ncbi:hypothetical protein CsatB_024654 [Cannabis sativa]
MIAGDGGLLLLRPVVLDHSCSTRASCLTLRAPFFRWLSLNFVVDLWVHRCRRAEAWYWTDKRDLNFFFLSFHFFQKYLFVTPPLKYV